MDDEPTLDRLERLDEMVKMAGNYIRPREALRARVLEGVRSRIERKCRWHRWLCSAGASGGLMILVVIGMSFGIAMMPRGRTADDLWMQAKGRATWQATDPTQSRIGAVNPVSPVNAVNAVDASDSHSGLDWAIMEVFADWRHGTRLPDRDGAPYR